MSRMKIYLLLAHPNENSFNGQIADAIESAMRLQGHQVRRQNIGQMRFDPVLWQGYAQVQQLEEDLLMAQQNILWCNKWVTGRRRKPPLNSSRYTVPHQHSFDFDVMFFPCPRKRCCPRRVRLMDVCPVRQ